MWIDERPMMEAAVKRIPAASVFTLCNRDADFDAVREITKQLLATNFHDDHKKLRALHSLVDDDSFIDILIDTAFILGVMYAQSKGGAS
jgi:hypothetical protein